MKEVSKTMEGRGMGMKVQVVKGTIWCMVQVGRIKRKFSRKK